MRRKHRGLVAAFGLCSPLFAVGCSTQSDSLGSAGDGAASGGWASGGWAGGGGQGGNYGGSSADARDAAPGDAPRRDLAPVEARAACETLTCFTACQEQIAVVPVEQPTGFVAVASPSSAFAWQPLGADLVLAVGRAFAEIRRRSDLSLLGSAALPAIWSNGAAVVGSLGFVRDGNANVAVLDLANPAAPRVSAWWLWAGTPAGSWRGKLVLGGGVGVSFLDVANPSAPVESFCLPGVDTPAISGDLLVAKRSAPSALYADVYRLDPALTEAAPWASIRIASSPPLVLEGTRLAVPTITSDLVLYDLAGAEPVEVARAHPTQTYYTWQAGGFFFGQSPDQSEMIALDLRGTLEPYLVSQVAGRDCLYRLDAPDGSAAFVVSKWLPGARFSPDSLPLVACPVADTVNDANAVAALSPDGHTLLLPGDTGWVFRDLDTGTDTILAGAPVAHPDAFGWVDDRIVAIDRVFGIETTSAWATLYAAADPATALATVAGLDPYGDWLGSSGGQLIGFSPAPGFRSADSPTLWLLDPQKATAVAKPLASSTETGYTGSLWNDKVVAFRNAEAIVFGLDGSEQGRITLPSFVAAATSRIVSDLGWFATTDAGEILRFDPASGTVVVGVGGCVRCSLLGADGKRIYVQALGPDALGPLAPPPGSALANVRSYDALGYRELRGYAVTSGSYPLAGRFPLTQASVVPKLLSGSKLALVADGALVLAAPP
jgi:hypothetical protein